MKKAAVICIALLTLVNSALAYENKDAGFKVNDKHAVSTTVKEDSYTFTCSPNPEVKSEHTHTINYVHNEVASNICGEEFSTSFFDEQFEKLTLLKRCELSLKTISLAIWNLDKYVEQGVELPYGNLDEETKKVIKSFLSVEKIGKHKVITVSHLYKQNRKLHALNTSILSANNKLYTLTTVSLNTEALTPKNDDNSNEEPAIIKRMQEREEAKLVNITPAELDAEVRTEIWEGHLNFLKSVKFT
ncbi:MAG: hypothetical protein IJX10_04255 [Phascolarctobacterium sp.]|nr:hypothetical protein [Phascolarctobacterium sp.]